MKDAEKRTTQIVMLPGMILDDWIFARMKARLPDAKFVKWIPANDGESIAGYAERIKKTISKPNRDVVVCGISFGGIVAQELAPLMNAKACVLISSIADARQLPPWFRVFSMISVNWTKGVLRGFGGIASSIPGKIRTKSTTRLTKFNGEEGKSYRWATQAVLRWRISEAAANAPVIQIYVDRDGTFPIRYVEQQVDHRINGGCHFFPLTHSRENSDLLEKIAESPLD